MPPEPSALRRRPQPAFLRNGQRDGSEPSTAYRNLAIWCVNSWLTSIRPTCNSGLRWLVRPVDRSAIGTLDTRRNTTGCAELRTSGRRTCLAWRVGSAHATSSLGRDARPVTAMHKTVVTSGWASSRLVPRRRFRSAAPPAHRPTMSRLRRPLAAAACRTMQLPALTVTCGRRLQAGREPVEPSR